MLNLILDQAFIKAKGLYRALDHDAIFIFGDLNFRIDRKNKEARLAVFEKNIEFLK
jgi:hypothetical protein